MPCKLGGPIGDLAFRLAQLALRLAPCRGQHVDLLTRGIQLGFGLAERDPEGFVVEGQQQVAGLDLGVIVNVHLPAADR